MKPSNYFSKNWITERKNELFKTLLTRIHKQNITFDARILIVGASFLDNMFHRTSILGSFYSAKGYFSSALGTTVTKTWRTLKEAHRITISACAINCLLKCMDNHNLAASELLEGTEVWLYCDSSKHNELPRWVGAPITEHKQHIVYCRRSQKLISMNVAYEHTRLVPKSSRAEELQNGVPGDTLSDADINKPEFTDVSHPATIDENTVASLLINSCTGSPIKKRRSKQTRKSDRKPCEAQKQSSGYTWTVQ